MTFKFISIRRIKVAGKWQAN